MKIYIKTLVVCGLCLMIVFTSGCITGPKSDGNDADDNVTEAEKEKIERKNKLNTEASNLYMQSRKFTKEGRYKEALDTLWKIPPTSNIFSTACLDIITLAKALDNVYAVIYASKMYIQLFPQDTEVMYTYAEYLIKTTDGVAKAEKTLNEIIAVKEDVKSYRLLAYIQLAKNEFASAEQTLNQLSYVLEKQDKKLETEQMIWLAQAKAGQNATAEADEILESILAKNPENRDALVVYLGILQDDDILLKLVNGYLEKQPEDVDIIKLAGDYYNKKGNYKLASEFFEKAVELRPNDLTLQRKLAESYMILGSYREASRSFNRLRRYLPDDENLKSSLNAAYLSLINKLKQDQNWAEVERYLRMYSWTNPENQELLFEISEIQEKRNQLLRARVTLETMIDRVEDLRRVYRGIARISKKLGDDETALEYLEKIMFNNPEKVDILQYVDLANSNKMYAQSYEALKPVYLQIFKDKQYYEQYRNVTFRLLKANELKDVLDASQADWKDSDNTFKFWAIKQCINELIRLKKYDFNLTSNGLAESDFALISVKYPNFSAKSKVVNSSQDVSGSDIPGINPDESKKTYTSSDIAQCLKFANTLYDLLMILEAPKEVTEFWKVVIDTYELISRTDFTGTKIAVNPLLENFDYVLKNKFAGDEEDQLRRLRIHLLLAAHKKGDFLKNKDAGQFLLTDIKQLGWKDVLTVEMVLALTDCASESPELSIDAIYYAIRCSYIIDDDNIELPQSWIQSDFTKIDTNRLPDVCFAKLKETSLAGLLYPQYYIDLQNLATYSKSTIFYVELYDKLRNFLEYEDRKASRAVLFEILALCQLGQNHNVSASFYLQSAVFELSTLDAENLTPEYIKTLDDRKFELYSRLGAIHMKLEKPELALQYYKQILESRPDYEKAYMLIIEALNKAERTSEVDNYIYLYLSNVKQSKNFRKLWKQLSESIKYDELISEYKNGNFETLRIRLTQLLTNYPNLYVLSFLLADCLESLGESWESEEILDKTINHMQENQLKGMILPVISYLYSSKNWQIFDEISEICDDLMSSEPQYYIVKARVNIFNEEFESAETNIKKADELLENSTKDENYDALKTLWLLEKLRLSVKVVTPESAIALLNNVEVEMRLRLKKQLLSDNDFHALWLSNILYNLLRCNNPEDFKGELTTGQTIKGEKYYEDDEKIHIRLPDGKYAIISKDKLKKD